MHTITKTIDDKIYHVHHNVDWSGEAIINYPNGAGERVEFHIPGKLLQACGRASALLDVISVIEQIE